MKQYFLSGALVLSGLFITSISMGQKKESPVIKKEEIIIKREGDKETKTIIEIDGEHVKVNGQPLEEYKGTDVKVLRRKGMVANSDNFLKRPEFSFNTNESRTFLGVLTEKNEKGAAIKNVTKDSPAEKAGLKEGDVITAVDNKEIKDAEGLANIIKSYKEGDEVSITYLRNNKKHTQKVTLGKSENFATVMPFRIDSLFKFNMPELRENLGGQNNRFFRFYNEDRPRFGLEIQDTENSTGVKILNVEAGSAAAESGLKKDDMIIAMNGEKVTSTGEVRSAIAEADNKEEYQFKIKRDNKEMEVKVKLPKKLNKMKL